MRLPLMLTASLATKSAVNSILYAAVADGTIKTLTFTGSGLQQSSSIVACGSSPSWLTFTPDTLFCSNEATPGSLSSFRYDNLHKPILQSSVNTTGGDVSSVLYGNGNFIALAHYGHSSISTYALPLTTSSKPLQNLSLPFPGPGPNPRQNTGYPHQVTVDPSGQYLFSPDLGADLVRVFSIDNTSGVLTQQAQIKTPSGSGPRHIAFYRGAQSPSGPTFVYLASELSNSLSGYRMDVNSSTGVPVFTQTVAPFHTVAQQNTNNSFVAEVRVSGKTLTISNRGDASFGTGMDSLTVFTIRDDGSLFDQKLYPSGGNYPRSFQINGDGTKVAVGNQKSQTVTIMKRDAATGSIGGVLGQLQLSGEVIDVVWAE